MYQEKLDRLKLLLTEHHNKTSGPGDPFAETLVKSTLDKLTKLGATSEEALAMCSYEDLESCGIPRLIAKQLAHEFRAMGSLEVGRPSIRTVERMTILDLLKNYDPKLDDAVSKRLKSLVGSCRCILFNPDQTVNIAPSLSLVQEIRQGFPQRDHFYDGKQVQPLYPIGVSPFEFVDENPLYPKRALRPDGTCDQLNRSWEGVALETRQLLYLAVAETKEICVTLTQGHTILDDALDGKKFFHLVPKAALLFQEREKLGTLPKLKISLNKLKNKGALAQGAKVEL